MQFLAKQERQKQQNPGYRSANCYPGFIVNSWG